MNDTVKTIFGLVGGLALFLFGMNNMSDALQKAAGEKMKRILAFLTRNPIMGALAGALVTAVLQSSSATTVMVIGFVSAGLMSLPQAISVIFGANIGTTMTAQLMAFKITNYIYPIIFIGFIISFLSKKEKIKNIGIVIFSFGLLFEGIEIMGNVMEPLATSPIFVDLMAKVKDVPVLGVLLGAVMTLVVQSSSATIAVLQSFASQPAADGISSVIGLSGAIPILLGDNIGTTITAILASIGQSKNAKRTAIAHSIFNITGSAVFIFIIPLFAKFIQYISPAGNEIDVISRQIANAHTSFNVACTLVWLPLIGIMVKIVRFLIPGNDGAEKTIATPQYLDEKVISQPAAAMYLLSNEVQRLSDFAKTMLYDLKNAIVSEKMSPIVDKCVICQNDVKLLQNNISSYVTKMFSSGNLTGEQAEQAAGLLFASNNIDRIADRCNDLCRIAKSIESDGLVLSSKAKNDLAKCIGITSGLFDQAVMSVETGDTGITEMLYAERKKMRKIQKKSAKSHLDRVEKQKCDPQLTGTYSSMLYSIERMADNCISIAEEAADNITYFNLNDGELKQNPDLVTA